MENNWFFLDCLEEKGGEKPLTFLMKGCSYCAQVAAEVTFSVTMMTFSSFVVVQAKR